MKLAKVEKLVTKLHDKTEYVIHIRNLNQCSDHGLILKKRHRVIKFNQKACLKPYTDMNIKVKKMQKVILTKTFSS